MIYFHLLELCIELHTHTVKSVNRFPVALPEMTTALMMLVHSPPQVIVTGTLNQPQTKAMVKAAYSVLSPQKTIILADGATESILYKSNKVLSEIPSGGQPGKAFYCRDFVCKSPFTDSAELVRLLSKEE